MEPESCQEIPAGYARKPVAQPPLSSNFAPPHKPVHRFLNIFLALSKALNPFRAFQPQNRLLASNRGLMATAKQIAANRLNSQKNTGPCTTAGKAVSRFNALKHGIFAVHQIMFDETPQDLAELSAEYHEHHSPANSDEILLVDTLVHTEWRLRRMRRIEAGLWQRARDLFIVKNIETTSTCNSGDAFATDSATFERLQRVVSFCERVYHRALKDLQHLHAATVGQALPPADPVPVSHKPAPTSATAPQPQHSTPTSAKLVSFRQNPQAPASAGAQPPAVHPDPTQIPLCDSASLRRRTPLQRRRTPLQRRRTPLQRRRTPLQAILSHLVPLTIGNKV